MKSGGKIIRAGHSLAMDAVSAGQCGKIGIDDIGSRHTPRIGSFLVHADGAVGGVVQNDENRIEARLHGGTKLIAIHLEITIAGKAQNKAVRIMRLGGKRGGHAKAHAATLRAKLARITAEFEELIWPHGKIASAMGDDGIGRKHLLQMGHDLPHVDIARWLWGGKAGEIGLTRAGCPLAARWRGGKRKISQQCRHLVGPGMERQIGGIDLAKLRIGGVAVNKRCRHFWRLKQAVASGGHFIKTDIESEDQIGIGEQLFHIAKHANTGIADITGAVIVDDVVKAEGRDHRDISRAGKIFNLERRLFLPPRAPNKDQWAAGGGQQAGKLCGVGGGGRGFGDGNSTAGQRRRHRRQHGFGKRHNHRPRAPGQRRCPGAADHLRHPVRIINLHRPFGNRPEKGVVIYFLKRLPASHVSTDLPDEQQHWQRILHRGMHADRGIGRPWPTGDKTQARRACQLAPRRRHIGRPAFLTGHDEVKIGAVIIHRVKHGKIGFARHAKPFLRTQRDKTIHQQLAAAAQITVCRRLCHHSPQSINLTG